MPILSISNLTVQFKQKRAFWQKPVFLHALNRVSLSLKPGEILGVAGESGSGKSTLLKAILGLAPIQHGAVNFKGQTLRTAHRDLGVCHDIQMVFQNPYASLNPRIRIFDALAEAVLTREPLSKDSLLKRVHHLMENVGLDPALLNRFPHAFSGGQRQRIAIARALATQPSLLLADEPTSALDVSVQAQILQLFRDLQKRLGLSIIFVSHSLGALAAVADRLAIFYLGRLVEIGPTQEVLNRPLHPYTQALRAAVLTPDPHVEKNRKDIFLAGEAPSPLHPPAGCPFHPRCHFVVPECQLKVPILNAFDKQQHSACLRSFEWASPQKLSSEDK